MVGFSIKKVNSLTLGEKMKEVRESLGVSLNEIAKATKIRKDHLEKIEQGRYEELPPDVYVRGFLKGYSKYLDIEVKDVLRLYEKERGIWQNIKNHKNSMNPKERVGFFPSIVVTPKILAILAFVLFVGLSFSYFYKEIGKFSQAPRLVVLEPLEDMSIDNSSVNIAGVTDKDSKISINGQAVMVDENGRFSEQISLRQGLNEMIIEASNRFGNKTDKKVRVSADFETQVAQQNDGGEVVMGANDEKGPDKILLALEIVDFPTWISVEVDGSIAQSGTMLPGSKQNFEALEEISITSGKADKTIIYLNGERFGELGQSPGLIRDVVFTKDTKIGREQKENG